MKTNTIIKKPFRYTFKNFAFYLIAINVIVYFFTSMTYRLYRSDFLYSYLSLNVVNVVIHKMLWQFITYMFVHGSVSHLFFNMLALFFFGNMLERAMGSKEFLLFYLLTGFLSGFLSFIIYYFSGGHRVFLMGASGAIYAILLAYAVYFPRNRIFIWGIVPVPAPVLVVVYAGIEFASQFLSLRKGVAHITHLAGFAFAWLYLQVRIGVNPLKVWRNAFRH